LDGERSAWSGIAGLLRVLSLAALYPLRLVLAPVSTSRGLRRRVLAAAPVDRPASPALTETPVPASAPAIMIMRALPGETKKAACERLYRAHPDAWNRARAPQVAGEIARAIGYSEGTARAVVNEALKARELETGK
jgi:hypothetical protein